MSGYRSIQNCRICGNSELRSLLDLGVQALSGIFPSSLDQAVPAAPLELVKCWGPPETACGLVQLRHSCAPELMYGLNYGYRSGLNASMVNHLRAKAGMIRGTLSIPSGSLVLDIGSNDSTLLRAIDQPGVQLVGMDPTGVKFREFYPDHVRLIPDFFSAQRFRQEFGARKARVVTSIAMLYDLEDPARFVRDVAEILEKDGVWVFEQSYLPSMLSANSYDTICHEHLEYYGLRQICRLLQTAGLRVVSLEKNDVNGGSFAVMACHEGAAIPSGEQQVRQWLQEEDALGLDKAEVYEQFRDRVFRHREVLLSLLDDYAAKGKQVCGYGASTKGNVLLQFCGLGQQHLSSIAEVNVDKVGCYTPGTLIPIVSEEEALASKPDAYVVLPWHFRAHIVSREKAFLDAGGELIFPLPELDIVGRQVATRAPLNNKKVGA